MSSSSSSSCAVPSHDGTPFSFGMESKTLAFTAIAIACTPFALLICWNFFLPFLFRIFSRTVGSTLGWYLRKSTEGRRALIIRTTTENEAKFRESKTTEEDGSSISSDNESWENIDGSMVGTSNNGDRDWDGIVGFFHPFCNAGGGGERVLWAAVRATQKRWPNAKIVVYTGDHDVSKDSMLSRVKVRSFVSQITDHRSQITTNRTWRSLIRVI